ncbi:FIG00656586: hypothetical protein [hydrothermal vent metagenome]|uniref:Uncharacterized protein n=1 Tax=hydrothermal vent metagenome TaxID=652676 RepID=A0A3B0T8T3_9ZZZZ
MKKNLRYLLVLVLAACSSSKGDKKSSHVFFAGEIVNPTNEYVVLYRGDMVLDSVKLDKNNRFAFELDSITEGLHHFNHAPEYQYIFLEKGDSLLVRLNTIDFDESMVFSGSGSEINNFLLDLFLVNEGEEKIIYDSYAMKPERFNRHIDSLHKLKLTGLNVLDSEVELSSSAKEIATASIDYTYFNYKEKYLFEHRKITGENTVHDLSGVFYAYRKNIDFDNSHLNYLRPYYNFMRSHIRNLAYSGCTSKCAIKNNEIKNQLHFNRHKLSLIDSLVKETELKDNLFRNVAFNYLLLAHDTEKNNKTFIEDFHLRSGNNRHIEEIDELYTGISNIQPLKKIPNVHVTNVNGERVSLREIAKGKKAVFYFWSGSEKKHFENIVKRAAQLTSAKKDYTFIGINIKTDETIWKGMIETKNLDQNNQYKADDFDELTKALIIYPLNKCIITDDAIIIDAFSTMYAASF